MRFHLIDVRPENETSGVALTCFVCLPNVKVRRTKSAS